MKKVFLIVLLFFTISFVFSCIFFNILDAKSDKKMIELEKLTENIYRIEINHMPCIIASTTNGVSITCNWNEYIR